jgi:hypothetical protein
MTLRSESYDIAVEKRPGGLAVFQAYNRNSWLNLLSKVMKTPLEHEDAPVLKRYSDAEFRRLVSVFTDVRMVFERFPVKSRLHKGWNLWRSTRPLWHLQPGAARLVRKHGWHMLAFCRKGIGKHARHQGHAWQHFCCRRRRDTSPTRLSGASALRASHRDRADGLMLVAPTRPVPDLPVECRRQPGFRQRHPLRCGLLVRRDNLAGGATVIIETGAAA